MNPVLYFVHGQVPRHKNRRTLSIIGGSENVDGRVPKNVSAKERTLVERPPAGPGWLHQIKFDGYRVIAQGRRHRAAVGAHGNKEAVPTKERPKSRRKRAPQSARARCKLQTIRPSG